MKTAAGAYTDPDMTADTDDAAPREKAVAAVQSVDRALMVARPPVFRVRP